MRIQLKRSNLLENGKAVEPDPNNMEPGELAINYNSKDPCLFIKTTDGSVLKVSLGE